MTDKITNLVKLRTEKTELEPVKKEVVDTRKFEVVLLEDHNLKVGDLFFDTENFELFKIRAIIPDKTDCLVIHHKHIENMLSKNIISIDYDGFKWSQYSNISLQSMSDKLSRNRWTRINSEDEIQEYVNNFEKHICDLSVFNTLTNNDTQSSETSLTVIDQNLLTSMEKQYNEKKDQIALLQAVARYKMEQLAQIKEQFEGVVTKIRKVIGKIELYLGVNEEVIQIQDGLAAPEDTPISLFQKILYMDEEVGIIEKGGLDWRYIDDFDNWLVSGHLDLIAPLQKCIVILKVRRKEKFYDENPWVQKSMSEPDKHTYILIRNGNKVYRIYAELTMYPRLFPMLEELTPKKNDYFSSRDVEERTDRYHHHFLVIQGILDRSEMLWPIPHKVDIFNAETWGNIIHLVRDDEMTISDGHLSYREWKRELNSHNKVGSRVVYCGTGYSERWSEVKNDRFRGGAPDHGPDKGVYNIKREAEGGFVFWFNPEDTIYHWDTKYYTPPTERKRAVGFLIEQDDYCILNYDHMKIEDIDFYINCRSERSNYLEMIPLLKQLKKEKLKELQEERAFVELVLQQMKLYDNEYFTNIVLEAIEWWKFKVIEKRPLVREDAKALRMITSRVSKVIQESKSVK